MYANLLFVTSASPWAYWSAGGSLFSFLGVWEQFSAWLPPPTVQNSCFDTAPAHPFAMISLFFFNHPQFTLESFHSDPSPSKARPEPLPFSTTTIQHDMDFYRNRKIRMSLGVAAKASSPRLFGINLTKTSLSLKLASPRD